MVIGLGGESLWCEFVDSRSRCRLRVGRGGRDDDLRQKTRVSDLFLKPRRVPVFDYNFLRNLKNVFFDLFFELHLASKTMTTKTDILCKMASSPALNMKF